MTNCFHHEKRRFLTRAAKGVASNEAIDGACKNAVDGACDTAIDGACKNAIDDAAVEAF